MPITLPKLKLPPKSLFKYLFIVLNFSFIFTAIGTIFILNTKNTQTKNNYISLARENQETKKVLTTSLSELEALKSQDQLLINQNLSKQIEEIKLTYTSSVSTYENLLKLKEKTGESLEEFDNLYTKAVTLLSEKNYADAALTLADLENRIKEKETKLAEEQAQKAVEVAQKAQTSNSPPSSGYSRQYVQSDIGTYLVSIVSADLSSTKVIVDTASASNCSNECPVLSLGEYVSRNNAYAGINGSYFCPASYPSCSGKTNSFDTLLMNKDKTYFNSDNNVYSTNPAVIFGGGWIRFVGQSLQWGRDTGIDSMISNYPMLVQGGNITFGGDDDPKKGSKGGRSFVANKGNTVYIGVVHSATVAESAHALKALGMENALNLDDGGSTALWSGGYKVGPGRSIPNAILFIRR